MMGNKKAKVCAIVSVVLALALFSFFFVSADNNSDNLTLPFEDNFSFNSTLENQTLNLTSLSNETVLINETPALPSENISAPEPPVVNSTLSNTALPNSSETLSPAVQLGNTLGHFIDYTIEQDGDTTNLYPNMLIDELSFISLSGIPRLYELGRTESAVGTFITTFVIDTISATFSSGSFTKRMEGEQLYLCSEWNDGCLTNWNKVQGLNGGDYTEALLPGKVIAYGEIIPPPSLGIASELGILAAISSTQADGLIVYGELNIAIPRYRTWNSSYSFSAEQNAQSLGTGGTDDITWAVTKANHERDEIILGTEDKSNDVNIQIYTPANNSWGNLLEVSTDVPNSAYRAFDIGIEDLSGDALIVYENSSTADFNIYYRIWNGTGYSSASQLTTGLTSSVINWVKLVPKTGADDIMLLIGSAASGLHAFPWNGTGFDLTKNLTLSTAIVDATRPIFSFAWEESSGEGLVLYGSSTNLVYRTYSPIAPYWSVEATISLGAPDTLRGIRPCSDPTSNHIGFIFEDSGNDVNVRMWDGTQILANPPTEDATTEQSGANNNNLDCAWYNNSNALFGFEDVSVGSNGLLSMDYFTFTKSNTWSLAGLTTAPTTATFATDDIDGLRFTKHPTTSEIMVTAMDIAEDISLIGWVSTGFFSITESPIETSTEVLNGAQEGVMFDWSRYDPVPNVTSINPDGSINYSYAATVNINVTVTDNINVSVVLANVTLPNGTIQQITLTDANGDNIYNSTFSATTKVGIYTIRIIANDTSVHQNINATQTSTFSVGDTIKPNVTALVPANNSVFNVSNIIEVAANVTDDIQISSVLANVTLPNGTITRLTLSLATGAKYNVSYTIPGVIGVYNITFIANDTGNNINSSETTNFTVNDIVNPNVTALIPAASTIFDVSNVLEVAANVSDDVAVSVVLANITYPNGTINQLTLSLATGAKYNNSFTAPALPGNYNLTIIANDTSNNTNNTQKTNFTVSDVVKPSVSIASPSAGSSFSQNANVTITATVTDDVSVSVVFANVTLPDNTYANLTLAGQGGNSYSATFTNTSQIGMYTIKIIANDSSNNRNDTVTRTFAINDVNAPVVTLVSPADALTQNSSSATFTCNATDNSGLANMTLYHNISGSFAANQTNASFSGVSNQTSFTLTIPDGTYLWNCFASDTAGNAAFAAANRTLSVDATKPNVSGLLPAANSNFNVSNIIEIAANVSDNFAVSVVIANFTYPNGTSNQLTLSLATGTKYNNSFTIPALLGTYNITFIANDSINNVNNSEKTNFTVSDSASPSITILGCTPSIINLTQSISCNATITDNIGISTVQANVTYPNSSVAAQTVTNTTSTYNFTFTNSVVVGNHTVTWWANDSSNNQQTAISSFIVNDSTAPAITLNSPNDNTNTSSTSVAFNFTATDNYYLALNCSFVIDGATNQTNSSTINGTATILTVTGLLDGVHNWNITCIDNSSNSNTSATRMFTVDTQKPTFSSLTTTPSSTADLDPNVNITLIANVTDNITAVNIVTLQYKLSNDSIYTNLTGVLSNGLYNASFNATQNGTYNLRVWANDTVGNSDTSALVNITVEYDKTWTRTPSAFTTVAASSSQNVTLGNITINNTGDFAFQYNLTSNSANTIFNSSGSNTTNFTLAAGAVRVIQVNDTAPTGGLKTVTVNISVNESQANPTSLTTTGNIVVAPGQPVLVATITTPASETRSVTQGDTGVTFIATLQNVGEGNASNVTFFFTMPSAWTVTFGQTNVSLSTLNSGESTENDIEVTIPPTATAGTFTVVANSTGVNASGADLGNTSLIFGDTVSVTVSATTTLGSGTTSGGTSTPAGTTASTTTGGGGGGTAGLVSKSTIGTQKQTIETTNVISVTRGGGTSTPVTVANLWENAVLQDISLSVSGFLSQYVVISPEINPRQKAEVTARIQQPQSFILPHLGKHLFTVKEIKVGKITVTVQSEPQTIDMRIGQLRYVDLDGDHLGDVALELVKVIGNEATINTYGVKDFSTAKLAHGETLNYSLDIYAPSYLVQKDYELGLKIDAKLIPFNATAAGFTEKVITELRTLLFRVREVGGEDAQKQLDNAKQKVQEMTTAGFNILEAQNLLSQAEDAFNNKEYDLVSDIASQIVAIHGDAFAAQGIIQQVQENIQIAEEKWLATPQTIGALGLAQIAFERGDYITALERAKNAQLILVLETKGRINLIKFVIDWWWALLIGLIVLSISAYFTYKSMYIAIIQQRLKNLNKEEQTIQELLEETQKKYFQNKSFSEPQYQRYITQYEKRLTRIRQLRVNLRNKRVALMKTESELKSVQKEKKEVQELLERGQRDYLVKGKLSQKKFKDLEEQHKNRLAEIEQEEAILQERVDKQKGMKTYKILSLLGKIGEWMAAWREKEKIFKKEREKKKERKVELTKAEHTATCSPTESPVDMPLLMKKVEVQPTRPAIVFGMGRRSTPEKTGAKERTVLEKPEETRKEKPALFSLFKKKILPRKHDRYAKKWVEIKIREKKTPEKEAATEESREKIKITNTPKTGKKAERMTEAELRKKFPGAFK